MSAEFGALSPCSVRLLEWRERDALGFQIKAIERVGDLLAEVYHQNADTQDQTQKKYSP